MRFRWAAAIALWTMLSGPVFGPPANSAPRHEPAAPAVRAPDGRPADPEAAP